MITGAKKTGSNISDKTRRKYYLLMKDSEPLGVCTLYESAQACLAEIARERKAGKIEGEDAYIYSDSSGVHIISIRIVGRLKMTRR